VPTYLEARAASGHAVPSVEVVPSPSQAGQEEGKQTVADADEGGDVQGVGVGEKESEMHAVLAYVVQTLHEALVIELLEGFHS
jgi:hypothetical protein